MQHFQAFSSFCVLQNSVFYLCRYCQVGNAVAVPVARALGYALGMAVQRLTEEGHLMILPPKFSHTTTVEFFQGSDWRAQKAFILVVICIGVALESSPTVLSLIATIIDWPRMEGISRWCQLFSWRTACTVTRCQFNVFTWLPHGLAILFAEGALLSLPLSLSL